MKLLLAAVVSGGAGALIVSSAAASALNNPCLGPGSRAATRVLVQKCNASNPFQQWTFSSNSSSSSTAAAAAGVGGGGAVTLRSDSSSCLSVLDFATAQESLLVVTPCHPQDKTPGHRNQEFSYNASDQVIEVTGDAQGMVVDLSNYGVDGYGEKVWIYPPTGSNNQQWAYDASTGLLHSQTTRAPAGQDDMCIDASPPKDFSHMPWCNVSLPVDERVADMVSRMTLAEKIPNLDTPGAPIPSLGLDQYNWWEEASSGVSNGHETTKFAFPITTGMSFNRTLWQLTGRQIGHEARALMNAGLAGSTFWAPVINLAREPRWGRNIEVPGEDPYLVGEYAEWFVKGFERGPEDPEHIQASACCKHYAANSMEHTTEGGVTHTRHEFSANITQQDLVDSYLLPFQSCVEKGEVSGLMCSYNSINGVPSCANPWLLNEVARGDWGFDGYITSDCDAVDDVFNQHHYYETAEETVAGVLAAGTDVDCTRFIGQHAQDAITKGVLSEADIDPHLENLFKVRMRLGHFDPVGPLQQISMDDVCSDYAKALSYNGVVQSTAMFKNANSTLPLKPTGAGSIAIIGPNANLSQSDVSYYGPQVPCDSNYWTIADAVRQYSDAKVQVSFGVPSVLSNDTSGIAAAVSIAAAADRVILAVGTDLTWAHEEHDADSIAFTDAQKQLIQQVAAAAKKPVTLVTFTATPLDISAELADPNIGAVLHVGQPSVTVLGLGDILFGNVSPAGRAVQTIYPEAYQDEVSIFDFNMRPGPSAFPRPDCPPPYSDCKLGTNPGRTHRFYTGKAVVPFGFGLSYTTFTYTPSASTSTVDLQPVRNLLAATYNAGRTFPSRVEVDAAAPLVSYNVKVTNTGSVDADDVVLGFLVPPNAGQDGIPLQTLFGFERVHVKAGSSVDVNIYPSLTDFAVTDAEGRLVATEGDWTVRFGTKETVKHGQGFAQLVVRAF